MIVTILLHSATGNTRLVTRYAAARLAAAGHRCVVHDIVRQPALPSLDDVDLLGVACPTMYFRPTFAMERCVAGLPAARRPPCPAFLLGTAGGEPGAHFEILAQRLEDKGYRALGAHWVISPDSWPLHHSAVRPLASLTPLLERLVPLGPRALRAWWALGWPGVGAPDRRDRARLDAFLDRVVAATDAPGSPRTAPPPHRLHRASLYLDRVGRMIAREKIEPYARPRFDAARCDGCATCVVSCPARAIVQASERAVPTVGDGCTGCFACYNRCPTGAIAAFGCPAGRAQYRGPSRGMRDLFSVAGSSSDE
jgi:Pyruvate/2-oxoacid:ferredoxin oxidoreductase delta subunit/flavodoxin